MYINWYAATVNTAFNISFGPRAMKIAGYIVINSFSLKIQVEALFSR